MHNFERDCTRQGQLAARGFHAGPIITAPGGYPAMFYGCFWHYEVATPAEACTAVEDLLDRGVDVIKIALEPGYPHDPWPVLTPEQVQAIVETAHGHGILVRAHVRQAAMLDVALEAGVDVVEHVPLPFCLEVELKQLLAEDNLHLADLPAYEVQLVRMVEQGVVLVPTLDANTCIISDMPRLGPVEEQAATEFLLEIVHAYRELGGVVVLGNDYGCPGVAEGMPLREMELLLAAGLTPMEVIEAGTSRAAFVSGHGDELGTLEPAKLADLIVVDGDPLNDIEAMKRVDLVIRGGKIGYIGE
jgi:enamidase